MKNMVLFCVMMLCGGLIMGCGEKKPELVKIEKAIRETVIPESERERYDGPGTRVEDHNWEDLKEKLNVVLEKKKMNNR